MNIDYSKWGLANQRLVFLLIVILTLGGIVSYYKMPKLEDPEIVVRQAVVVGIYPGASAHQVELELTEPLENSINKTENVLYMESYSYPDMCYILVTQKAEVPPKELSKNWQQMRNNIAAAQLPQGTQTQVRDDFGAVSGLFYSLSGEGMASQQLEQYAKMIRRELQRLDGVNHVDIYGAEQQCVNIALRQDKLANLGLLPAEVLSALNGQDATVYSGYFLSGEDRIRVSVNDRYRSIDDIRNLILQGHQGDQFRLGDIADVSMEPEKVRRAEMLRDGKEALGLLISAESGTDIIKVGRLVEEHLEKLKASRLPHNIQCEKVFFQSNRVEDAMRTFVINLVESVLLVIVLLMFCMNFRSGLILGITLIITVLGTILILNQMDGALQRVSLGSFILAMGMLVDNAIVIIDGILVDKQAGKPRSEALSDIGRKTSLPLLGATLIAILAFLPIFISPDVTGLYVRDMFIVLAVSLLLSWVLALVFVPIMASRWIYKKEEEELQVAAATPAAAATTPYAHPVYHWFTRLLEKSLRHRWLTVSVMICLLVLSGIGFQFMPQTLFPDMEYDQLYMEYKLPEGVNTTRVKSDLEKIRKELMQLDYVTHVTTSIGNTPGRYNLVRPVPLPQLSYGELIIDFKSSRQLEEHIVELQKHISEKYPDAYLLFKRYNLMFMRYPIELAFQGPDPAVLHQLADSAMALNRRLGAIDPVTSNWSAPVPTLVVDYDQTRARQRGVSRTEVGLSLMSATDGLPVGRYYDGNVSHNLYVSLTDQQGQPLTDLNNATVFSLLPQLNQLPTTTELSQLALNPSSLAFHLPHSAQLGEIGNKVHIEWEPPVIPRYNGERIHSLLGCAAQGYLTEEARSILAREIDKWELPEGYSIRWGGEKYASDLSIANLFAPYPLVFMLMLGILVAITRRFRTSLLLFCCIPFVFVGIIPAILISDSTFNFVAIVGALGLVGMMLKNGIVLVEEIQLQLQQNTMTPTEAIITASRSRLRPVTMASLTTILGMLPLLFDDMFSSMAATIMGGLFAGTIIVLIFIPVLYSLFFKFE